MKTKCHSCGHENISGADRCGKCRHSLTQKDLLTPGKDKLQKLIMTEKVSDFISKIQPIILNPETPVSEVIEKMHEFPMKGCVLVCDAHKKLVGIVSIRDILLKVAGSLEGEKQKTTSVKNIMTPNPEWLDKDAPLAFALHKMFIGKFRHVPVLDNGIPIGVVSTRDIIEYFNKKK